MSNNKSALLIGSGRGELSPNKLRQTLESESHGGLEKTKNAGPSSRVSDSDS